MMHVTHQDGPTAAGVVFSLVRHAPGVCAGSVFAIEQPTCPIASVGFGRQPGERHQPADF